MLHLRGTAEPGQSRILLKYDLDNSRDMYVSELALQSEVHVTEVGVVCQVRCDEDAVSLSNVATSASLWGDNLTVRALTNRMRTHIERRKTTSYSKFLGEDFYPAIDLIEGGALHHDDVDGDTDEISLLLPPQCGFFTNSVRLLQALGLDHYKMRFFTKVRDGPFVTLTNDEPEPLDGTLFFLLFNDTYKSELFVSTPLLAHAIVRTRFDMTKQWWETEDSPPPVYGFGRCAEQAVLLSKKFRLPFDKMTTLSQTVDRLQKAFDTMQHLLGMPDFLRCAATSDDRLAIGSYDLSKAMTSGFKLRLSLTPFGARALRLPTLWGEGAHVFTMNPQWPGGEQSVPWTDANNPLFGLSAHYPLIVSAPESTMLDKSTSYATGVGALTNWCFLDTDGKVTSRSLILRRRLCRLVVAFYTSNLEPLVFTESTTITFHCCLTPS
jgi:hypothetical protein